MNTKRSLLLFFSPLCLLLCLPFAALGEPFHSSNKSKELNAPSFPQTAKNPGYFTSGEMLFWKARESGLTYATTTSYTSPPPGELTSSYNGTVATPDFSWDFGFRIGAGYNFALDGWDLFSSWTRFRNKAKDGIYTTEGARVLPEFAPFTLPDQNLAYNNASSCWNLFFDTLDLQLGKEFFVSKNLSFRPHIGLRAAWIDQTYTVSASGSGQITLIEGGNEVVRNLSASYLSQATSDFTALGPRMGLQTDWILGAGFSIYAHAALSLLLGNSSSTYKGESHLLLDNPSSDNSPTSTLNNSIHDTKANSDLEIALRWTGAFLNDSFEITLHIGWSHLIFFDQNHLISFTNAIDPSQVIDPANDLSTPSTSTLYTDTSRRGNLTLQGVTAGITMRF